MKPGRMVIAGGTGFLGRALAAYFSARHWDVVVLGRSAPSRGLNGRFAQWSSSTLGSWTDELDGTEVVVNLTGKSVNCRYNGKNRDQILNSRVQSTRVLGEAILQCKQPPRVWLNASTATIYKHTFGEAWDETGEIGATPAARDEFSVQVALAWEDELAKARTPHTRKIALRTAMVLGEAETVCSLFCAAWCGLD
jgi:NAD dependent epimerase/dehydratase family enzyme